jgi:RHS repeat-associated protein
VLLAFLLAATFPTLADDAPAAVPQAVKALEHLRPKPDAGPFSWTAGEYRYDGAGNITGIGSESFVYDKVGRLRSATVRGPDLTTLQTQTFAYDDYGNLTSTSKLGQTVDLSADASTNRLASVGYDASGNVVTSGTQHYDYDALGMLNTVRIGASQQPRIVYAYTADDERLFAFDVAANTTHWTLRGLDNKVLRDFKQQGGTWSVERDYIYRDGLLLAALKPAAAVEHYTLDHLGTPRLITDAAGNKIGYHAYWPFGEEWTAGSAQEGSPLKFTGHERDADASGGSAPLDYMHARYYRADLGRFVAVDKYLNLDANAHEPQRWNAYAYGLNNPIRLVDVDGAQAEEFQKPITKVIGRYMYHFDWTHGGLHIDVSKSSGGNWKKLGRLGQMLEPIEHAGEESKVSRAAVKNLLKNRSKLGVKAEQALASLLEERAAASVAGKTVTKVAGGAVALAVDLVFADKLNAQNDKQLMRIEQDVLKEHFGGRTVDKLSDEERQQYFDLVNDRNSASAKTN